MFKNIEERWKKLAEADTLYWLSSNKVVKRDKKYTILRCAGYHVFPTVEYINLSNCPTSQGKDFYYPVINIDDIRKSTPKIRVWGTGTEYKSGIISYGVKLGRDINIYSDNLEEEIAKGAI